MKKWVALFSLTFLFVVAVQAKPTSHFSFKIGPYWQNEFGVKLEGNFTLDFWVAHVQSDVAFDAFATDNSVLILPASMVTYVNFNWQHLLVEYGAPYHSKKFVTCWDVGNIPTGWKIKLKARGGNSLFSLSFDRKTYDLNYENPFLFLDAWWYADHTFFTLGAFNIFASAGNADNSHIFGAGGNVGNLELSLFVADKKINIFPNLKSQIPSRYVGILRYDSKDGKILVAMTENEFYANSTLNFNFFNVNEDLYFELEYLDTYPYTLTMSGGMEFKKKLSANSTVFLSFSYEKKTPFFWIGTEWRF